MPEFLDGVPQSGTSGGGSAATGAEGVFNYATQRTVTGASESAILVADGAILFDSSSNAIAITLPAASVGKVVIPFKDAGCNIKSGINIDNHSKR
jgi:hypothetical protein